MKFKRNIPFKHSLHFGKEVKYIVVSAIIAAMLMSFYALLPQSKQGFQGLPQNSADPPSSTTQYQTDETEKNDTSTGSNEPTDKIPKPSPTTPSTPRPSPTAPSPITLSPQIFNYFKPPGVIESAQVIDSAVWKEVAKNAWRYFQPGVGVNSITGLPNAGYGWPYFTDWDLGGYLQTVIDAQKIGLIEKDEQWGANYRIEKILTFLENRQLTNDSQPYWFYQAENGNPSVESKLANSAGNVADAGKLLVSLQNLETYNSSFTPRIDNIVYNRTNYSVMLKMVDVLTDSVNIYDYYISNGFAAFWTNKSTVPASIISNIISAPQKDVNGVKLPISKISCEPIFLSIFDLKQPDSRIFNLSRQVYLAHEAWYNATGQYRAFSEGLAVPNTFVYEWVILPDGRTWIVQDEHDSDVNISATVYSKIAFSFLAVYNTVHARNIVIHIENALPEPKDGYYIGVDEAGNNIIELTDNNSNGLIVSAARYAIQNPLNGAL
jgi:hypothetical protein